MVNKTMALLTNMRSSVQKAIRRPEPCFSSPDFESFFPELNESFERQGYKHQIITSNIHIVRDLEKSRLRYKDLEDTGIEIPFLAEKGRRPTQQECDEAIDLITRSISPESVNPKLSFSKRKTCQALILSIKSIQNQLEFIDLLDGDNISAQDFRSLYSQFVETGSISTLSVTDFLTTVLAQTYLQQAKIGLIGRAVLPFFVEDINNQAIALNHQTVGRILAEPARDIERPVSIDAVDQLIYGCLLLAIQMGSSYFIPASFQPVAWMLPLIFSNPSVMYRMIQTNLFREIKENIMERIPDLVLQAVTKFEKAQLEKTFCLKEIEALLRDPETTLNRIRAEIQGLLVDKQAQLHDLGKTICVAAQTGISTIARDFRNAANYTPEQLLRGTCKTVQYNCQAVLSVFNSLMTGYQDRGIRFPGMSIIRQREAFNDDYLPSILDAAKTVIDTTCSPEWGFYLSYCNRAMVPLLFLSDKESTDLEIAAKIGLGYLFSQCSDPSITLMAFVSVALGKIVRLIPNFKSDYVIKLIDKGLKNFQKLTSAKYTQAALELHSEIQRTLGISSDSAHNLISLIEQLSLASVLITQALVGKTDKYNLLTWLYYVHPMKTSLRNMVEKMGLVNPQRLVSERKWLLTLPYTLVISSLLILPINQRLAACLAVLSHIPMIKDQLSKKVNVKLTALLPLLDNRLPISLFNMAIKDFNSLLSSRTTTDFFQVDEMIQIFDRLKSVTQASLASTPMQIIWNNPLANMGAKVLGLGKMIVGAEMIKLGIRSYPEHFKQVALKAAGFAHQTLALTVMYNMLPSYSGSDFVNPALAISLPHMSKRAPDLDPTNCAVEFMSTMLCSVALLGIYELCVENPNEAILPVMMLVFTLNQLVQPFLAHLLSKSITKSPLERAMQVKDLSKRVSMLAEIDTKKLDEEDKIYLAKLLKKTASQIKEPGKRAIAFAQLYKKAADLELSSIKEEGFKEMQRAYYRIRSPIQLMKTCHQIDNIVFAIIPKENHSKMIGLALSLIDQLPDEDEMIEGVAAMNELASYYEDEHFQTRILKRAARHILSLPSEPLVQFNRLKELFEMANRNELETLKQEIFCDMISLTSKAMDQDEVSRMFFCLAALQKDSPVLKRQGRAKMIGLALSLIDQLPDEYKMIERVAIINELASYYEDEHFQTRILKLAARRILSLPSEPLVQFNRLKELFEMANRDELEALKQEVFHDMISVANKAIDQDKARDQDKVNQMLSWLADHGDFMKKV